MKFKKENLFAKSYVDVNKFARLVCIVLSIAMLFTACGTKAEVNSNPLKEDEKISEILNSASDEKDESSKDKSSKENSKKESSGSSSKTSSKTSTTSNKNSSSKKSESKNSNKSETNSSSKTDNKPTSSKDKNNVNSTSSSGKSESVSSASSNKTSSDSKKPTSSNKSTTQGGSNTSSDKTSSVTSSENVKKSTKPEVTTVTKMASGIFLLTGTCSVDTEKIVVSGEGIEKTEITPNIAKTTGCFFGQVKVTSKEYFVDFSVQAQETGLALSDVATRTGLNEDMTENLMMLHEYAPFFGTKGRIHYYSALLSYSLSDVITQKLKSDGKANISKVVNAADEVGAEVIYLVAPSSAEIYPETIPEGFSKAGGETVFEAFESVATDAGATVIYPAETMKAHKNDGAGFDIYHNTDSHWSAYGAYWALYDLMNYISQSAPAAKPRTLEEMGFYTKELCGGDAFFTYTDRQILETIRGTGFTPITKIKEFTTLYTKTMPTNTLNTSFKNGVGVDIFNTPSVDKKQTVVNPNGKDLPTAMIVRDSFGVTPFDMFNDRFSTIWWSANGDIAHKQPFFDELKVNKPEFVIFIVSERNLAKILANNVGMALPSFVK